MTKSIDETMQLLEQLKEQSSSTERVDEILNPINLQLRALVKMKEKIRNVSEFQPAPMPDDLPEDLREEKNMHAFLKMLKRKRYVSQVEWREKVDVDEIFAADKNLWEPVSPQTENTFIDLKLLQGMPIQGYQNPGSSTPNTLSWVLELSEDQQNTIFANMRSITATDEDRNDSYSSFNQHLQSILDGEWQTLSSQFNTIAELGDDHFLLRTD